MPSTFFIALAAILSILCVIVVAVLLRRAGRIAPETDHGLMRLTIDLLLPCLIFDRIIKTDAFSDVQNLWLPPLLGFGLTGLGILLGFVVAALPSRRTGLKTWKQKRTFAACVGVLNYGFVPIPLVAALFPDNRTMGVQFLQYLGAEVSIWTLVIFTMMGRFNSKSWRHVLSAPVLSVFVAVPLNLLGNSSWIPQGFHEHVAPCFDFLLQAIHMLGQAAIPASLLTIGFTITGLIHRKELLGRWQTASKIAFWSCVIRLVAMPSIFLALAVFLPCTVEIKRILVIHGAMGSAIFPVVLTRHYKGNTETAFDTILSNTLLSIVTLPIWITIGLELIG